MFKQAEKRVLGSMRGDRELEMLLSEIPHMTSFDHHLHRQNDHQPLHISVSPISSSSLSGSLSSSERDFSPSGAQMDQTMYRTPNTQYLDSRFVNNSNDYMLNELGLCENLRRMNMEDAYRNSSKARRFGLELEGFGLGECSLDGTSPCRFQKSTTSQGFSRDFQGHGAFHSSIPGNLMSSNDELKAKLLGLCQEYNAGNLMGSRLTQNHSNAMYSEPIYYPDKVDHVMDQRNQRGRVSCSGGLQMHKPNMNRLNDALCYLQQSEKDLNGDRTLLNPANSPQLLYPNLGLSARDPVRNSSMSKEKNREIPNGRVPPSPLSVTDAGDFEAFSCEDSFIIQGKSLKYVVDKRCDRPKGQKKRSCNEIAMRNQREKAQDLHGQSQFQGVCENGPGPRTYTPLLLQPECISLAQVQGDMYFMAKDQHGCRFLQKIIDEGTCQDVQLIFNGIINHVVELMINPFGNYLMQRLLEVCSEEQRMQIVLMVTEEPGDLVKISLNTHGTRVVQKLIETLKTRQQISLVVLALQSGFLDLIMDLNGNHVIQRCLQYLSQDDNKFIFDGAAKFCVDIATHQHGCCVLNRCIVRSVGKYREKLVSEIASNGLLLAQDAYGNYVIQYVIELKIPFAAASLISQFEGHYVHLSMQKFSSHVVEKCLNFCEEGRPRIIQELLSVPHFEQLLQDPFANYVVKCALEVSKGTLHAALVEAVRPHTILRTSPYCKKIFSGNLLKK